MRYSKSKKGCVIVVGEFERNHELVLRFMLRSPHTLQTEAHVGYSGAGIVKREPQNYDFLYLLSYQGPSYANLVQMGSLCADHVHVSR